MYYNISMNYDNSDTLRSLSPTRKRPQVPFSVTEKLMVRNVFKHVYKETIAERMEDYDIKIPRSVSESAQKTAKILGISVATVFQILKEYKEKKKFESAKKPGPKNSFKDKYDNSTFEAINQKYCEVYAKDLNPTIAKVLEAVKADPNLPKFSKTTLGKIIKYMNTKEYKTRIQTPKSFEVIDIKVEAIEDVSSDMERECLLDRETSGLRDTNSQVLVGIEPECSLKVKSEHLIPEVMLGTAEEGLNIKSERLFQ